MSISDHDLLIAKFLSLQKQILECCDNEPAVLEDTARLDPKFMSMCLEYGRAAATLEFEHRSAKDGLIAPVSDTFIRQWRYHQEHLHRPIAILELSDLVGVIFDSSSGREDDWTFADNQARDEAISVRRTLRYMRDIEDGGDVLDGISGLERLAIGEDFDLQGFFRRVEIVPLLLVPQKVARTASSGVFTLYQLWSDARRAFIFGAPLAALALARALLEKLLLDFFKANGGNLKEMIGNFSKRSNPTRGDDLHRIRIVANVILHPERELRQPSEFQQLRAKKLTDKAVSDPEREVVYVLEHFDL